MKKIVFLSWMTFLYAFSFAEEAGARDVDPDLARKAVSLSAQADAYALYCGKESALAQGFLDKFSKSNLSEHDINAMIDMRAETFKNTTQTFEKDKPDCQDITFMIQRFEIMRNLKNVSYEINGIDHKTTPNSTLSPEDIQMLFPAEKGEIPQLDALSPKEEGEKLP